MLEDGRLHLSHIARLSKWLRPENAEELFKVASGKTKGELMQLLAERFPQADARTVVQEIASGVVTPLNLVPTGTRDPARKEASAAITDDSSGEPDTRPQLCPDRVPQPETVVAAADDFVRVVPTSPKRYSLQGTMPQEMFDLLREACELASNEFPRPDELEVLHRALKLLVPELRKRKFAATEKPGPPAVHDSNDPRYIPAEVKRAVWERDGGQCTFRSAEGRRCSARMELEFNHEVDVYDHGHPTIGNITLRCRPHNQLAADDRFGPGFMEKKRNST